MLKVVRWVGVLTVALACGRELPSTTPLGSGPLAARPGELDAPRWTPVAPEQEAGAPKPQAGRHEPSPREDVEASSEPSDEDEDEKEEEPLTQVSDAGAPDAASAADARATAATPRWPGEYRGEDVSKIRFEGVPERIERDPAARVVVTDRGAGSLGFGLIDSSNGQTLCTLHAAARGGRAEIDPGQTCFAAEATTGVVEEGSAKLEKDRLTLDLEVTVRLQLGSDTLEGSIDYHFEGRRR